jgi:hypothetical protein
MTISDVLSLREVPGLRHQSKKERKPAISRTDDSSDDDAANEILAQWSSDTVYERPTTAMKLTATVG